LEEALALDDNVERIVGDQEVALLEDHFVGDDARTEAQLQARRKGRLLIWLRR
jgi:hypothetical protein